MENPLSDVIDNNIEILNRKSQEHPLLIESKKILEKVKAVLVKSNKYLATDEVICACYLNRFLRDGGQKDYDRFKEIFNRLSQDGRYQAINQYLIFARNEKDQSKNVKKLMKK